MIEGVWQVVIDADAQDRALEFWTDTVGVELAHDAPYGEGRRWIEVTSAGRGGRPRRQLDLKPVGGKLESTPPTSDRRKRRFARAGWDYRGGWSTVRLVDGVTMTSTGVMIATCQPVSRGDGVCCARSSRGVAR